MKLQRQAPSNWQRSAGPAPAKQCHLERKAFAALGFAVHCHVHGLWSAGCGHSFFMAYKFLASRRWTSYACAQELKSNSVNMLGTLSADLMLQACLCTTDVSHNVIMCCSPYMHQRNAARPSSKLWPQAMDLVRASSTPNKGHCVYCNPSCDQLT